MRAFLSLLLFILCLSAGQAHAMVTDDVADRHLTARILSAQDTIGDTKELSLLLQIELAGGWHTYWRMAGDAGQPPQVTWDGSTNIEDVALSFPPPQRESVMGMETIGYKDAVAFPLTVRLLDSSKDTHIKLRVDLLVCGEQCLPKHLDFALDLPAGNGEASSEAAEITKAIEGLPRKQNSPALSLLSTTRSADAVTLVIQSANGFAEPDVFLETTEAASFAPPERIPDAEPRKMTLRVPLKEKLAEGLDLASLPLTATITNSGDALEIALPAQTAPVQETMPSPTQGSIDPAEQDTPQSQGFGMLLLALLGGLILNLMPCVLPVLSLKVLSLVRHGGAAQNVVRRSFLATGGGIVVSFILLAFVTITLRYLGTIIGWGVQFQEPVFILFMLVLLTLFSANLWGFFQIGLPRWIMDRIDATHHPKLAGDFATGMLATLLATPCSAPFLGTAVSYALAAAPHKTLAIFIALGIGMALPYFLIAAAPRLASCLPKPGAWMVKLTRLLGFGLFGTALWLLYVLVDQIGFEASLFAGGGVLCLLLILFLRHVAILKKSTVPLVLVVSIAILGLGVCFTTPASLAPTSGAWEPFNEMALHRYVREGKTVFVDITADWCLTCKANKKFTLSRKEVVERLFGDPDVIAMQGDWTNPDPALTAFLHKNGRYGIPFNAVYGPKAKEGILLSELLTISAVTDALDEAKLPKRACPADLPSGAGC